MSETTQTAGSEHTAYDGEFLVDAKGIKVHFPIKRGVIFDKTIGHVYAVDGVDLQIRTGGSHGQSIGLANVLNIGGKLRIINDMLQHKAIAVNEGA